MFQRMKLLLKKLISNPEKVIHFAACRGLLSWMPDKLYLKLLYFGIMGKKLNLDDPKTLTEKIQWLKLNNQRSEYTKYVDKFAVREHIKSLMGDEYLIPLLGVYDKFDEIDFNMLPEQFVLKCTHDSGSTVICRNKKALDLKALKKSFEKNLRTNHYRLYREWPYKNVKPRIICEQYMTDESGVELKDYKFMCFNGEAKCLFVCSNRKTGLCMDFFYKDWLPMPVEMHYHKSGKVIDKPENYEKMIEFAETLSKGIPFVSVDLYEANKRLYFGELTLFTGSGFKEFTPESYDELLGSWIKLPNDYYRDGEKVRAKLIGHAEPEVVDDGDIVNESM